MGVFSVGYAPAHEHRLVQRYGLAFGRLVARIGSDFIKRRPRSRAELEALAELALAACLTWEPGETRQGSSSRAPTRAEAGGASGAPGSDGGGLTSDDGPGSGRQLLKPAEPLSLERRAAAIAPEVAGPTTRPFRWPACR